MCGVCVKAGVEDIEWGSPGLTPSALCFPGLQVRAYPAAGVETQQEGDVCLGGGDTGTGATALMGPGGKSWGCAG